VKLLVIDDEPQIRRALRAGLEPDGYTVLLAASGEEGLDQAALHAPDLVILDLAMPGIDGLEVCRQLRQWSQAPILVLSVHEGEADKVAALDLGADDYVTKPFSLEELRARLRALLRRRGGDSEAPGADGAVLTAGDLRIDFARRRVTLAGQAVHLTPLEYELLAYLAQHPDRVLTHRQILTRVWGAEYAEDLHTLRVHVANLRAKIEPGSPVPRFIHTHLRIGYRFSAES
jgi:two-component system, OmpR family, KDP operon response regulator KdpE